MPSERARAVIFTAKALSVPARCSPSAVAMSFAERVISDSTASLTVMVRPAGTPSFDGGWDAAYFETVIRVSSEMRRASSASKTR